jgi:diguanylate cyclase (GGDEF)-like protein
MKNRRRRALLVKAGTDQQNMTPGACVNQHTVLVISESKADHLILSSSLDRAVPQRFQVAVLESMERPLEALLDPANDIVIIAYGPETEYLLRLAQKNNVVIPIIVLLDEARDELIREVREFGAQDYLVRGQLHDDLIHRILDYGIQLKSARQEIQQLSNRDSLTGALNRVGFRAHLERAMDRSERYGFNTALLYINIDGFQQINDYYGEAGGDMLIKTVATRLSNKMRSTDSIARIGGDEFAVVLEDVSSGDNVATIAEKMLRAIAAPMLVEEQQVCVDASIGGAIYPDDARKFSELVDCSRSAMQQAKSVDGSKYIRYSEALTFDDAGNTTLAAELRNAVRRNEFVLHYQPRIDLKNGRLVGLEALIRWHHPERGLVPPGEFLPECEKMGLMKNIGYQVIQHACSAITWLAEQGMDAVDVAVNVSFSQFQDDRFVEIVKDIIKRSGVDARRLEFELTESTILKSPASIKERMNELRMLGLSFSLDDFGTGFSQLSHIMDLPIIALKIDACFVRELPDNKHQEALCMMIIDMAQRLDMMVVAEGAETREQVDFLIRNKCDQVQGFYYSPAIPMEQLPRFVQEQRFKRRELFFS